MHANTYILLAILIQCTNAHISIYIPICLGSSEKTLYLLATIHPRISDPDRYLYMLKPLQYIENTIHAHYFNNTLEIRVGTCQVADCQVAAWSCLVLIAAESPGPTAQGAVILRRKDSRVGELLLPISPSAHHQPILQNVWPLPLCWGQGAYVCRHTIMCASHLRSKLPNVETARLEFWRARRLWWRYHVIQAVPSSPTNDCWHTAQNTVYRSIFAHSRIGSAIQILAMQMNWVCLCCNHWQGIKYSPLAN